MFTINIIRHNILTIISNHNYDDNLEHIFGIQLLNKHSVHMNICM